MTTQRDTTQPAGGSPLERGVRRREWCRRAVKALLMLAVWLMGCVAFDAGLQLDGPWLMFGGAVTWMICDSVGRAVDALAASGAEARGH